MNALRLILRIEGALCALFGLWSHSWPLILAGVACWAVMPLIGRQLGEV
jgi:hypothetical protein